MKIFAVIVTYNGMRWIDRCFDSLLSSESPIEIIAIDNASTDGTPEHIKNTYPQVILTESKDNLGFAKANNIGIRYAYDNGADYILLLNQDAWTDHSTVSTLAEMMAEDENLGILSPIHMNGEGSSMDWWFMDYLPKEMISDTFLNHPKERYPVEFVNAAAWLISRRCIETVGGFDTSLFVHYGEDTNYCQRVRFHGFGIAINTTCKIYHDREFRRANEKAYRMSIFRQEHHEDRKVMGNILEPLDIEGIEKQCKRRILKAITHLKFNRARQIKEDLSVYKLIGESRKKNSQKGLTWL